MKNIILGLVFLCLVVSSRSVAQSPPRTWSSAEIAKKIDRLRVVGSVLYVAAHPDDENTAFLATMVNGHGVRSGYVALTRGEGGQNLIGSEQGSMLGMIRSQELMQARRIDGAEQFFTRAIDFGYSKTTEETLEFWGKNEILGDLVYIIRSFRPDVIVTRFLPDRGGHGNHTSSALIAIEAFDAAGDPKRFPEHLAYVDPWQPVRIMWNGFRSRQSEQLESANGNVLIDLGAYDPVLGVSYSELAGQARSMHKSQGFGASQSRGSYLNSLELIKGTPPVTGLFDGLTMSWGRFDGTEQIVGLLDSLQSSFSGRHPEQSIPLLFSIRRSMEELKRHPDILRKMGEVDDLIVACAGLWADVAANKSSYVLGDSVQVTLETVNRSPIPFTLESWSIEGVTPVWTSDSALRTNESYSDIKQAALPETIGYTQPVWLEQEPSSFTYRLSSITNIGVPENPPVLMGTIILTTPYGRLKLQRPVRFRTVDPVDGESYIPLRVIPRVTAAFSDKVVVVPANGSRTVTVRVSIHAPVSHARIAIHAPKGWSVEPTEVMLSNLGSSEERSLRFTLSRSSSAATGLMRIVGEADGEPVQYTLREATYAHIPPQTLLESASVHLIAADIKSAGGRIGYIMGAGDEVPDGLRQIGYDVELLSDEDLLGADLSVYASIVAGVRAYNTRPTLLIAEQRLKAYMEKGGVFVAQYLTTSRNASTTIGPFPLTIGRDRVTDEHAAMRLLRPDHPVFLSPNRIVAGDFDGWVQERGLYFAERWDDRYTPLIACADPGEEETQGCMVFAPVGSGAFFYTGISFFRQLPAGVPGAYRLMSNMLSYGRTKQ